MTNVPSNSLLTSTGCKHMRASPVPLRGACWRKRTAWSIVQRGQRSLRKASQPQRPGVASDGEGGHSGIKGAVRPAQNWWEATWRCRAAVVETRKVRHVGRLSGRHSGSVIRARNVPDSKRSSRGGIRKEKKQVLHTKPIVLVCSNRGRNDGGRQKRRGGLFVRTWKAHYTKHRRPPQERIPLSATLHFNSTLQCGRCFGYIHPHNPRGRNVAVPAFVLVFSLVFSPQDLYRGRKIIIINIIINFIASSHSNTNTKIEEKWNEKNEIKAIK